MRWKYSTSRSLSCGRDGKDVARGKPDPALFLLAAQALRVDAVGYWYVKTPLRASGRPKVPV